MTTTLHHPPTEPTTATRVRDTPAPSAVRRPRSPWFGFAAVITGAILNILDSTLVNVAGPSIRADLAMTPSMLEWIAAAYTLALAVGLMTGARMGDIFGRKRMFLLGLSGFILTSLLCSVAWNVEVLIAGRALQGVAGALMLPQCFGLYRDLFPPDRLGKAFGALGPVIGMSTVLGPIVAGYLIDADIAGTGWRAVFLINLPLGIFALILGWRVLPESSPVRRGMRLDVIGTVLLGVASILLVFPLVDGRTLGWPAWCFVLLALSVPAFGAFVTQQRARRRAGQTPLIEFSVLRKRTYLSGVVFVLFFFGTLIGFSLVVGMFLQIGLGFSAEHASHYLAASAVGAFFGAGIGAWATKAVGRPILHIGLGLMAAGTTLLLISLNDAQGTIGFWQLAPGMALFGLGMGQIFVPLFSIIMGEISDEEVGSASGLLTAMEQLGASIGIAVLGTVFFNALDLEHGGPVAAVDAGRHLTAVENTLVGVLIAIAIAWAIGWLLPRRGRTDAH